MEWKNINTASQQGEPRFTASRGRARNPTRPVFNPVWPSSPSIPYPSSSRPRGRRGPNSHRLRPPSPRPGRPCRSRLRRAQTPRGQSLHVLPRPNSPRDAPHSAASCRRPQRRPLLSPESSVGRDPSGFGLGPIPSRAGKQFLRVILRSLGWIPLFLFRTIKPSSLCSYFEQSNPVFGHFHGSSQIHL